MPRLLDWHPLLYMNLLAGGDLQPGLAKQARKRARPLRRPVAWRSGGPNVARPPRRPAQTGSDPTPRGLAGQRGPAIYWDIQAWPITHISPNPSPPLPLTSFHYLTPSHIFNPHRCQSCRATWRLESESSAMSRLCPLVARGYHKLVTLGVTLLGRSIVRLASIIAMVHHLYRQRGRYERHTTGNAIRNDAVHRVFSTSDLLQSPVIARAKH